MWKKGVFNIKNCGDLLKNSFLVHSDEKFRTMSKQKQSKKKNEKPSCELGQSSKEKYNKKKSEKPSNEAGQTSKDTFISLDKSNNILLNILAKPGAKQNKITDMTVEGVGVQISAPPSDGEANAELLKYISGILGLRKNDITLERGFKSRQKTLKISASNMDIQSIKDKLQKEMEEN